MIMIERRLVEGTVGSIISGKKWLAVRDSMRSTRKVLRFLRTLEYSARVRSSIGKLREGKCKTPTEIALTVLEAFSSAFTFLFFIFDHRVFLAEVSLPLT